LHVLLPCAAAGLAALLRHTRSDLGSRICTDTSYEPWYTYPVVRSVQYGA